MIEENRGATRRAIDYFKAHLENGEWQVGQKIPSEHTLVETLGISRASVRAAIRQFIGLGALESQHGRGTFVRLAGPDSLGADWHITPGDCADLFQVLEFRRLLETESCLYAAQNATPALLDELRGCLAQMSANINDPERFVAEDQRFHAALCHASGNRLLEKSLLDVFANTAKDHLQLNGIFGCQDGIYYHRRILQAMEAGRPKAAARLMHEHLQQAIDRLAAAQQ